MRNMMSGISISNLFRGMRVKKALVSFLFLSMLINGFVPRSYESRNSLLVVLTAVTHNAIADLFKEYRDSLTVLSNKLTKDLCSFLRLGEVSADIPLNGEAGKKEPIPVNASTDSGIVKERKEIKAERSYIEAEEWIYESHMAIEKLYRIYGNIKEYCSNNGISLSMMMLFIIVILRKKDITGNKELNIKRNEELIRA